MEAFLQEGVPVDISYFNLIVCNLYSNDPDQNSEANQLLMKFKERKDAWLICQSILPGLEDSNAKFIALEIFSEGAKINWELLEDSQKLFFRKFFFDAFFQWSQASAPRTLMNELSRVLITILKNGWPSEWPNFMHDFLAQCKNVPEATLNGLNLLLWLSEDFHEYSDDLLTFDRMKELSRSLENEYGSIFLYLETVSSTTDDQDVIIQALHTLSHYLRWMELQTIASTQLCYNLVTKLFPFREMRYSVLLCFESIATNELATFDNNFFQIFQLLVQCIQQSLVQDCQPITGAYNDQQMSNQLIMTLGHFLIFDQSSLFQGLMTDELSVSLCWLVELTEAATIEVFKSAVEFWVILLKTFNLESHKIQLPKEIVYRLQDIFIQKMAEPAEFACFFPDEDNFINDTTFEENMRLSIVCLSNLERENMIHLLLTHLKIPSSSEEIVRTCWATGAISGSIPNKDDEQQFLIEVMTTLGGYLNNEEAAKTDPQSHAIIYGSFLYILALYPRFLSLNWPHMKLLLEKILECYRTPCQPLQTMAVTTTKNLALRVSNQLNAKHTDQAQSFLFTLLQNAEAIASVLPEATVPILYEAMAIMIKNHRNENQKAQMVAKLLILPLKSWEESVAQLTPETAREDQITLKLQFPIDIFGKIILISNFAFYPEIENIITRTQELYSFYSAQLAESPHENLLRIKTQILHLYEAFLTQHPDSTIVPGLIEMLLIDYSNSSPEGNSRIIDCFTAMINKLGADSQIFIQDIMIKSIMPTLELLQTLPFSRFPEIRLSSFKFINTLITKLFPCIQTFDFPMFTTIINCLLDGIANQKYEISYIALDCICNLFSAIDSDPENQFRSSFYNSFYFKLLFQLFSVLTDRSHKNIFLELAKALMHLFQVVLNHKLILDDQPNTDQLVCMTLSEKLSKDFPQIQPENLIELVKSLIIESANFGQFQQLLRNFLIDTKKMHPSDIDLHLSEERNRAEIEILGLTGPAVPAEDDETFDEELISEF